MKKIRLNFILSDIFQSSKILAFLLFIATSALFTLILASSYYMQNIVANGISKKNIIARKTFEVVDTKKTDYLRQEAASKIKPLLVNIETNYIKQNLKTLNENIIKIKNSSLSNAEKEKQIDDLFDINDKNHEKEIVHYMLVNSEKTINNLFKSSEAALVIILQHGISEAEFHNNHFEKTIAEANSPSISSSQIRHIMMIMENIVVPNLIVDEHATEAMKNNAKESIKPYTVTFKRGDYILREGEPVTQFKKDALKKAGYTALELNKGSILGLFLLVSFTLLIVLTYIRNYEKSFFNFRYMLIQATLLIISCAATVAVSHYNAITLLYLIIPAYMIILVIFTSPILASLSLILVLSLFSVVLNFDQQLIMNLLFVTIITGNSVSKINYTKRYDLIKCGFDIAFVIFAFNMIVLLFEWELSPATIRPILNYMVAGFSSCVVALGCLPFIEKIFKTVTPYGLIELADHNQELLAMLQYKAPGTYHHSLMVANLCEGAAEAIGGNPILARVGAFYHDIGKLERPLFFIENQSYFDIENPHVQLNPRLSKMVITSHTKDGVKLAKEHGLPQSVINFIQQHHGESLAGHFYQQAIKEEGKDAVSEEQFRYPGPKPNTKETAILMLADAVESAVRSLKNPAPEEIENMISKIITERLNDGQLSDSPLTLKDIKLIAATFNRILRGMQHDRIKYQENIINEFEAKNKIHFKKPSDDKVEKKIEKRNSEKENEKD